MKYYLRMSSIFCIVMLAALFAFYSTSKKYKYEKRDITYYNDLVFTIEEEYAKGVSKESLEEKYDCEIVISKEIHDPELANIYGNNSFVLDFAPNGEYIGKIAWADSFELFHNTKRAMFNAALILWVIIFIAGFCAFVTFYFSFIKPVENIKHFAEQISKGNLDEPIPMSRNALFSTFLEGFDLMRIRLKEARQKEIDSEKARKELVTQLSHDIKTPISIIRANCELLELKIKRREDYVNQEADGLRSKDEEIEEYEDILEKIGVISKKAQTVTDIVNNVIHATLEELESIDVNVDTETLEEIDLYLRNIKDSGKVTVKNKPPKYLVYMDKLRLEQVIDNIIGNSLKYAGTDIEVNYSEISDAFMADGSKGTLVKITIRDFGPGAEEEDMTLLSEKYYRGKNAKESDGYGLGLYLVKWYMDKMGGALDYYNDGGFVVELTLKKV